MWYAVPIVGIAAIKLRARATALTSDGEKFDYVYNPWGQLVRVVGLGGDPVTKAVAVYTYSAMGHRISEQLDTNDGGNSGMADTVVDSNDPVFYIATDPSGRRLATYRDLDSDPKESFIHHDPRIRGPVHQGVGGGPILRDRNASLATVPEEWASVGADPDRYERHYYALDYRGYVSAIFTSDGKLVEQVRYSATGVPFNIPLGDVNADGNVEAGSGSDPDYFDINDMITYPAKYHVRGDLDLDGDVDSADLAIAQARDGTGTGRGRITMAMMCHRVASTASEYTCVTGVVSSSTGIDTLISVGSRLNVLFDSAIINYEQPQSVRYLLPVIEDKSCAIVRGALNRCNSDPAVIAAMDRYNSDCLSSARARRKPLRIVCTFDGQNSTDCLSNTIRFSADDCGSLAHEILHAADNCIRDNECTLQDPPTRDQYCLYAMCTEARASAYGSCCDPSNDGRIRFGTWKRCVDAYKGKYLRNPASLGCENVAATERVAAWDQCVPQTEAEACSRGGIPQITR